MPTPSMVSEQSSKICSHFSAVVGAKLLSYETAELLENDGTWTPWPDLPIRLYTDSDKIIAIAWSEFDNLWIRPDLSLPFPITGSSVRWVRNSMQQINGALGGTIRSVMIGRGEMSIDGREVEVWTRLVIKVGENWLEIYNALDENGYQFHTEMPPGQLIRCI